MTIGFMDGSHQEVHLATGDSEAPYTWQTTQDGLMFKYKPRGRRVIFPWRNIKWYEVYPRREQVQGD